MNLTAKLGLAAVACLLVTGTAFAQSEKKEETKKEPVKKAVVKKETASAETGISGQDKLKIAVQTYIRTGYAVDYAKRQLLSTFDRIDVTGGGVTEEDYTVKDQINEASRRGYAMQRWMKNDLNGDGEVTRKEIAIISKPNASRPAYHQGVRLQLTEEQVKQVLKSIVDKAMKDDINKDGKISYAEAVKSAKYNKRKSYRTQSKYNLIRYTRQVPLALDADKDGKVTRDEYEKELTALLTEIDEDKDGKFSVSEVSKFNKSIYALQRELRKLR